MEVHNQWTSNALGDQQTLKVKSKMAKSELAESKPSEQSQWI